MASSLSMTDLVTRTIYSTMVYSSASALVTSVVPIGTTCIPAAEAEATPSPLSPGKGGVTSVMPDHEITKTLTEVRTILLPRKVPKC
jgi:hypothetical protein